MERNLDRVLSVIERKVFEAIRLIENEEFSLSLQVISEGKRNLLRIRSAISAETLESLQVNFNKLEQICQRTLTTNNENSNGRYFAPRIKNGRGRPAVFITKEQIELLIGENFTARQIAQHFNCSEKLIYKKCYSFNIKLRDKYFTGTDAELEEEISRLHVEYPNSGAQVTVK
ncbi:unnamed protein product [Brassicogethes aeneus]|uniref:Uncharacterized protein n=1 Tax=Brassicogethes aeneus TaxID=1431903 RepID=A0A9P0BG81_BRAAE|nr:unnamed protein product [Brassicogethes aeneus]